MTIASELKELDFHIAVAEERVAEQKQRIARLEAEGHPTDSARELLAIVESSLALLVSRRGLLKRQSEP